MEKLVPVSGVRGVTGTVSDENIKYQSLVFINLITKSLITWGYRFNN
jgi:hypothetical protein